MTYANELRREVDRILDSLVAADSSTLRRLVAQSLNEVQRALRQETHAPLITWASKQHDKETTKAALFVSCTAVLRLIDKLRPSQFAAADRFLQAARHLVAREISCNSASAMIA